MELNTYKNSAKMLLTMSGANDLEVVDVLQDSIRNCFLTFYLTD
jgi:hypothetical protein